MIDQASTRKMKFSYYENKSQVVCPLDWVDYCIRVIDRQASQRDGFIIGKQPVSVEKAFSHGLMDNDVHYRGAQIRNILPNICDVRGWIVSCTNFKAMYICNGYDKEKKAFVFVEYKLNAVPPKNRARDALFVDAVATAISSQQKSRV